VRACATTATTRKIIEVTRRKRATDGEANCGRAMDHRGEQGYIKASEVQQLRACITTLRSSSTAARRRSIFKCEEARQSSRMHHSMLKRLQWSANHNGAEAGAQ
jgi:hypothetical protein